MVAGTLEKQEIMRILQTVCDPEIPVISVVELGIVRDVRIMSDSLEIDVSPTYSGCPALDIIPVMIKDALMQHGYPKVSVSNVLSPPWTTDWISESGKEKLKGFGIAPPVERSTDPSFLTQSGKIVPCPFCASEETRLISQFGSTPCKAAYQCNECLEPFDYFKCH